jgi:hypothetical protein
MSRGAIVRSGVTDDTAVAGAKERFLAAEPIADLLPGFGQNQRLGRERTKQEAGCHLLAMRHAHVTGSEGKLFVGQKPDIFIVV